MANKILTNVQDVIGNDYATDVVVYHPLNKADISVLETQGKVGIIMEFYKSQTDKEAGKQQLKPVDSEGKELSMLLVVEGITSVADSVTKCQEAVTEHLKGIYGELNVIEI